MLVISIGDKLFRWHSVLFIQEIEHLVLQSSLQ